VVTLEEYKKALGSRLGSMSDEEIKNRMERQAKIAKAFYDSWSNGLKNKTASVNK
jgi:hypothetical protein